MKNKTFFSFLIIFLSAFLGAVIASYFVLVVIGHVPDYVLKFWEYNTVYDKKSASLNGDYVIESVSTLCSAGKNEYDKVICVQDYFKHVFVYKIYSPNDPTDMVIVGGNCASSTLYYKAIFDRMGIKNNVIKVQNHIHNYVELSNMYCLIDQAQIFCVKLK